MVRKKRRQHQIIHQLHVVLTLVLLLHENQHEYAHWLREKLVVDDTEELHPVKRNTLAGVEGWKSGD